MSAPKSAEVRARALEIYARSGPTAAANECGVAKSTVCAWAREAGVTSGNSAPALREATERSIARRQLNAAQWREAMTEILRDTSMAAAHLEQEIMAGSIRPSLEKVTAARTRATSDLLLITGEATTRIGHTRDQEEHAASIARLRDELEERRKARGA